MKNSLARSTILGITTIAGLFLGNSFSEAQALERYSFSGIYGSNDPLLSSEPGDIVGFTTSFLYDPSDVERVSPGRFKVSLQDCSFNYLINEEPLTRNINCFAEFMVSTYLERTEDDIPRALLRVTHFFDQSSATAANTNLVWLWDGKLDSVPDSLTPFLGEPELLELNSGFTRSPYSRTRYWYGAESVYPIVEFTQLGNSDSKSVPEPTSILALLSSTVFGLAFLSKSRLFVG